MRKPHTKKRRDNKWRENVLRKIISRTSAPDGESPVAPRGEANATLAERRFSDSFFDRKAIASTTLLFDVHAVSVRRFMAPFSFRVCQIYT
jgi:hypothetical protein